MQQKLDSSARSTPADAARRSPQVGQVGQVCDGVAIADERGEVTVQLPAWFHADNRGLRYQLTAIAAAAPDLHIAREVEGDRFAIAGATPGMRVCWQISGATAGPIGDAIADTPPHYVSIDDGGIPTENFNGDGAADLSTIAIGPAATATGLSAIALGFAATASADNGLALGPGAMVAVLNSVALGANSLASAPGTVVPDAKIGDTDFFGFAGVPCGVVSVGSAGQERQISNVAAGQVTESSTDAINGSQLYSVASLVAQLADEVTQLSKR